MIVGDTRLASTDAFGRTAARFRPSGLRIALVEPDGTLAAWGDANDAALFREILSTTQSDFESTLYGNYAVEFAGTGDGRVLMCVANCLELPPTATAALAVAARDTLVDLGSVPRVASRLDNVTAQLADSYEELSLLYRVTGGMIVNRDPEDFFRAVCNDVRAVLGTRVIGAAFRPGRGLQSRLVVTGDLTLDPPMLSRFTDETFELLVDRLHHPVQSAPGTVVTDDALFAGGIIVNDLEAEPHYAWLRTQFKQLMAVPLTRDRQILGFLFAIDRERGKFDSVDAKLLSSVANASAIYAENALLYDDVHGLVMGLLHALTSAVDAKDSYTCGHSHRVALLSRELAIASGFDEADAERVYIAGLLHDVGKIGVPEAVLSKTGRLTEEEFDQMKLHPLIGAKILADVRQVQDIIPGVLHHHERWDGQGYPYGFSGVGIPLLGRLIGLADSFDAMTSNRTYRSGMPLEKALAEITRCAGKQFDPTLAKTFLTIGEDKLRSIITSARAQSAPAFPLRKARAA